MTRSRNFQETFRELRRQAEQVLQGQKRHPPSGLSDEFLRLVHELETHQVELELQNDELQRTQTELEESRNRFADLFDNAPVAYLITDSRGMIRKENRRARALLGKESSLVGRFFSALVHPDDLLAYFDCLNRIADQPDSTAAVAFRLKPAAGRQATHVRLQCTFIRDSGQEGGSWRFCLEDVTRQKEVEQELERLAASLEAQVRKRTSQLEQSEARAREQAKQRQYLADRLVDLLEEDRHATALMLHDDIGQILTGVKMQLEGLRVNLARTDPEPAGQLDRATEDLREVVSRLRNTSRQLHPASLDVLGLEAALDSLKEAVRNSGCRLHNFFQKVPASLDPDRSLTIFRIAQEAVTNAVRHSGCREIYLSLLGREGALHLSVEDDGGGFAYEKTVSDQADKNPLGLVIMRERAVRLGGSLHVDTAPERGTVVTAEIPLEGASDAQAEAETP